MQHDVLAELLGQDELAEGIFRDLESGESSLVRLTGAAGSGKSYVARQVAREWRANVGRCVVAVGDSGHSWRELYPLLSGLSQAHRDWIGLASKGTRSAIRVAESAGGGPGAGTSIFDLLTATFRHQTERALRQYAPLERDVVLDLRRLARSHRLLLVADNVHWWDADSLRLLCDVLGEALRESIPALDSIAVLVVDTADEQTVVAPEAFEALVTRCVEQTRRSQRCTREEFPAVLAAFGVSAELPETVAGDLFSVTHGHLELAQHIAAYQRESGGGHGVAVDEQYLSSLISVRLAPAGALSAEVRDLLLRAAVLGLSCTERDLECITDRHRAELRELVARAEDVGFIERGKRRIAFRHDVIRSAVLNEEGAGRLTGLYLKLADCLAILHPGDYEARARALGAAGDGERVREMTALAAVARLRRGVRPAKVLRTLALSAPGDAELVAYVEVVASGYAAVASGEYAKALPNLSTAQPTETTAMAAERHYVAALCGLRLQRRDAADEARRRLRSWETALEHEPELALRFAVLLQQAEVLCERFDDARATELVIEQKLSARVGFDDDAVVMIHLQNRRAGALFGPEVAAERIRKSVEFFARGTDDAGRDLELFRSLTNLAAIEVRLDRNADAYAHTLDAERIALESLDVGHRLDVLANNMVLAGYRSGTLSAIEAADRQTLIVRRPDAPEDSFLERCNLSAYLLLAERDDDAVAELDALGSELRSTGIDETYLLYYWNALWVASAAVRGETDEALRRHGAMDDFVNALRWPYASYVRRRQQLLAEAIPTLSGDEPRVAADRLLLDSGPMQIGPGWPYYGRLIPCCELSFWSES